MEQTPQMHESDKVELVRKDYDDIHTWYNNTYDATQEFSSQLASFIGNLNFGSSILDVGAGNGKESIWFKSQGFHPVAFDLSDEMLNHLRILNTDIPIVTGDMRRMGFGDAEFDAIWACRSIIHIPNESLTATLAEFHRVLKDRGRLGIVFLVPNDEQPYIEQFLDEPESTDPTIVFYRNLYSREYVKDILEKLGFKIRIVEACKDRDGDEFCYVIAEK